MDKCVLVNARSPIFIWANSLNLKKPAKEIRDIANFLMCNKLRIDLSSPYFSTISERSSCVIGSFRTLGFERDLFSPSAVFATRVSFVGSLMFAIRWAHEVETTVLMIGAGELTELPRWTKYNETMCGSAGSGDLPCDSDHCCHLVKYELYWATVEGALDLVTMAGSWLASWFSSWLSVVLAKLPIQFSLLNISLSKESINNRIVLVIQVSNTFNHTF